MNQDNINEIVKIVQQEKYQKKIVEIVTNNILTKKGNILDEIDYQQEINGFYINLDYRFDRKSHFEEYIKNFDFFKNIMRFSAIKFDNGAIGCGLSHIEVLKILKNIDSNYFCVFEDDFMIYDFSVFNCFMNDFEKIKTNSNWDIILLTPFFAKEKNDETNEELTKNKFIRICNAQTTTAYIIKKSFINVMIDNFIDAVNNLLNNGKSVIYAIDIYWKKLQKIHKFYTYKLRFAKQLVGFSDIEKKRINYDKYIK